MDSRSEQTALEFSCVSSSLEFDGGFPTDTNNEVRFGFMAIGNKGTEDAYRYAFIPQYSMSRRLVGVDYVDMNKGEAKRYRVDKLFRLHVDKAGGRMLFENAQRVLENSDEGVDFSQAIACETASFLGNFIGNASSHAGELIASDGLVSQIQFYNECSTIESMFDCDDFMGVVVGAIKCDNSLRVHAKGSQVACGSVEGLEDVEKLIDYYYGSGVIEGVEDRDYASGAWCVPVLFGVPSIDVAMLFIVTLEEPEGDVSVMGLPEDFSVEDIIGKGES